MSHAPVIRNISLSPSPPPASAGFFTIDHGHEFMYKKSEKLEPRTLIANLRYLGYFVLPVMFTRRMKQHK